MRICEVREDDDIWAVRDLSIAHHEEFGAQREYDSAAVCNTLLVCRQQKDRTTSNCWVVYKGDGQPVGYLYAVASQSCFSFRLQAEQIMWYVLPEFRGTSAAVGLIRAFEGWCVLLGCEWAYMNVDHIGHDSMRDTIMTMMSRLGYRARGVTASKKIG